MQDKAVLVTTEIVAIPARRELSTASPRMWISATGEESSELILPMKTASCGARRRVRRDPARTTRTGDRAPGTE